MKWTLDNDEIDSLRCRQARARLPFSTLLLLYLHPFALFMDTSRGAAHEKRRALFYNRARRWMLLPYARRWSVIAASLYLAVHPVEALAAKMPAAAFAVGSCMAFAVTACTLGAYVLLGATTTAR